MIRLDDIKKIYQDQYEESLNSNLKAFANIQIVQKFQRAVKKIIYKNRASNWVNNKPDPEWDNKTLE